jgi:hypothetical protein
MMNSHAFRRKKSMLHHREAMWGGEFPDLQGEVTRAVPDTQALTVRRYRHDGAR